MDKKGKPKKEKNRINGDSAYLNGHSRQNKKYVSSPTSKRVPPIP